MSLGRVLERGNKPLRPCVGHRARVAQGVNSLINIGIEGCLHYTTAPGSAVEGGTEPPTKVWLVLQPLQIQTAKPPRCNDGPINQDSSWSPYLWPGFAQRRRERLLTLPAVSPCMVLRR